MSTPLTEAEQAAYDAERRKRLAAQGGWVGVDLDGTLAMYGGFQGHGVIGKPIPEMVARVQAWLRGGVEVRIFTARAGDPEAVAFVEQWCATHIGQILQVTNIKDHLMIECWDDRSVQVIPNTGRRADDHKPAVIKALNEVRRELANFGLLNYAAEAIIHGIAERLP